MENKKFPIINDIREVRIQVYVIGGHEQGESIIFVLYNGENILFSTLIDSYEENDENKTHEILTEIGIDCLDIVCWSHPHDDHTLGLCRLMNDFCDKKKTIFLTPKDVVNRNNKIRLSQSCLSVLDFFDNLHAPKRIIHNHEEINTRIGDAPYLFKSEIKDLLGKSLYFNIKILSPITNLVTHYISYRETENMNKNVFSIALLFDLSGKTFLFSSDVEDNTIKLIDKDVLSDLFFLKTPHHTSTTSKGLYKILNDRNDSIPIAVTTVNRAYGLPDALLIEENKYLFNKFACTNKEEKDDWGYVLYDSKVNDISTQNENLSCYESAFLIK